ncbi:hypothetical protein TELCIR_04520 [Teladorsagia circumcincta]|uniref:Endonuclease/exonuclease/phosphatase domain-containing protein n=1 Tax=Teladorsagia circumcincta TaxID=45464 RepID=A0A2G9UTE2_TELCI|nr:hypothetical protein TELCIR_04520 [Teladorsagia circumcincta]
MTVRINTKEGYWTLISIYAPQVDGPEIEKDEFFLRFDDAIRSIPDGDYLSIAGDLNGHSAMTGEVREQRLRWNGHVLRRPQDHPIRTAMEFEAQGKQTQGAPKKRWGDLIKKNLTEMKSDAFVKGRKWVKVKVKPAHVPLCKLRTMEHLKRRAPHSEKFTHREMYKWYQKQMLQIWFQVSPQTWKMGEETTNKYNIAESRKSGFSLVTDAPILNSVFSPKNKTYIGTWNVRTLNRTGNLAQLLREFDNYRLCILGISEVRWKGNGRINSDNKTILFSGREDNNEGGVGFVLNKKAADGNRQTKG